MEYWSDALPIVLAAVCLLPLFLFFCSTKFLKYRTADGNSTLDSKDDIFSKCISPNCVRCQNYGELNHQLKDKFQTLLEDSVEDLFRIRNGIYEEENAREERLKLNPKQQPNVFYLPGLNPVQPFLLKDDFLEPDFTIISNSYHTILGEFLGVYDYLMAGDVTGWLRNSVPSGDWFVFHLYNQGMKMKDNCRRCPSTAAVVEKSLSRFMQGNAFGNASFSVLQPGTHITEHFGPCNLRIRCHLDCWLIVDGIRQEWKRGECVMFDDSFLHEAKHCGNKYVGSRAVFIVDLWHPDISKEEITCLNKLFSLE